MRHLIDHRKLSRTSPHRKALLRNMVTALIEHGRIQTTLPKAKELQRLADRVVTWGKDGTLAARRHARQVVHGREALSKLFDELAPRFAARKGGYTRILKMNFRPGDQTPMALVEYLDNPVVAPKKKGEASKEVKETKSAEKKEKTKRVKKAK